MPGLQSYINLRGAEEEGDPEHWRGQVTRLLTIGQSSWGGGEGTQGYKGKGIKQHKMQSLEPLTRSLLFLCPLLGTGKKKAENTREGRKEEKKN